MHSNCRSQTGVAQSAELFQEHRTLQEALSLPRQLQKPPFRQCLPHYRRQVPSFLRGLCFRQHVAMQNAPYVRSERLLLFCQKSIWHGHHLTDTTWCAGRISVSPPAILKTALGVPAAAQTSSNASRSSSTSKVTFCRCPSGGTPPMANPVTPLTKSASPLA